MKYEITVKKKLRKYRYIGTQVDPFLWTAYVVNNM